MKNINTKFGIFVDEDHNKLSTLYWLTKLRNKPVKSRFIANSTSCTTNFDFLPYCD